MTEKFTLSIELDNAAFDEDEGGEIARLLREMASRINGNYHGLRSMGTYNLYDANGNWVGEARIDRSSNR